MRWLKLYENYKADKAAEMIAIKQRIDKEMSDFKDGIYNDVSEYLYDITDSYKVDNIHIGMDEDNQLEISMDIYSNLDKLKQLVEELESASDRMYESLGMTIVFHKLLNIDSVMLIFSWTGSASLYFNEDDEKSNNKKKILKNTIDTLYKNNQRLNDGRLGYKSVNPQYRVSITIV